MRATCIKFDHQIYQPEGGDPIPMLAVFLDIEGMSDVVKVQISEKKVQGTPCTGDVFVDCGPRFSNGGRIYWKPCKLTFPAKTA